MQQTVNDGAAGMPEWRSAGKHAQEKRQGCKRWQKSAMHAEMSLKNGGRLGGPIVWMYSACMTHSPAVRGVDCSKPPERWEGGEERSAPADEPMWKAVQRTDYGVKQARTASYWLDERAGGRAAAAKRGGGSPMRLSRARQSTAVSGGTGLSTATRRPEAGGSERTSACQGVTRGVCFSDDTPWHIYRESWGCITTDLSRETGDISKPHLYLAWVIAFSRGGVAATLTDVSSVKEDSSGGVSLDNQARSDHGIVIGDDFGWWSSKTQQHLVPKMPVLPATPSSDILVRSVPGGTDENHAFPA
ncbi:hypothetical protein C8R47DRAFT_1204570 [Mycena vitilis]|nr:hypothetical protein C8R47DRAFT_1204570 [Mycena vitilis]